MYTGPVYSFQHNWDEPVVERFEWLTQVMRKRSGKEQRVCLRSLPRRILEYTTLLGGVDEEDMRRRYDALIWSAQDQAIVVPVWSDANVLTSEVNSGTTIITTPVVGYDYDDGANSYVILWRDYKHFEVIRTTTVLDTSGGRLTLGESPVGTWPIGTVIAPAKLCFCDPSESADLIASDIKEAKTKFEIINPIIPAAHGYRGTAPTLDSYRSVDVFALPGMDGSNTLTTERSLARIDFQTGIFHNDSIQSAPFGTLDYRDLFTRAGFSTMLGWLLDRKGRQKHFWFPSWQQDFTNVVKTDDAEFTADSFKYTALYTHKEGRRDIVFIQPDYTMMYRRITASSDDGTTETFIVDSDLEEPLPTLDRVSFLKFCRIDSDAVEFSWITTDDVATVVSFRELIKTA